MTEPIKNSRAASAFLFAAFALFLSCKALPLLRMPSNLQQVVGRVSNDWIETIGRRRGTSYMLHFSLTHRAGEFVVSTQEFDTDCCLLAVNNPFAEYVMRPGDEARVMFDGSDPSHPQVWGLRVGNILVVNPARVETGRKCWAVLLFMFAAISGWAAIFPKTR